jgi:DNA-binding YbaB/EbfC family protein
MFGQLGQLGNLLRNAGKIREDMQEMQTRLDAARITGEAGGEQVSATVNGKGEIVSIKIAPQLVADQDVEMIEDLVVAAVRTAVDKSREHMQQEMQAITGGMDLGGLSQMLGGGGEA